MNTFALMIELRQSKDRMSFVSPSNDTSAMMSVRCAVALYTHDCRPCASIVIRLMDWVGHWVTLDTRILARWQFLCAKHDELVSIWILIMSSVRDRMRLRCRRKVMKEWISSDVEIPFDIEERRQCFGCCCLLHSEKMRFLNQFNSVGCENAISTSSFLFLLWPAFVVLFFAIFNLTQRPTK